MRPPYMLRTGRTPVERAAGLLSSEIGTWALRRALAFGTVTPRDLERQFPAAGPGRLVNLLRLMAERGELNRLSPVGPHNRAVYGPGNLTDLRTLHAALTDLLALSPTPEVPREAE
ncbi:hypothetical protein DAETH_28560 [Deinococcus aetherius]|uniref:DUF742 domain-containing protein n=1 Tax=Deinococcus aetherius TaxID=200252 RepID=A0ABM8AGG4_9DEIO|nr:hypothetical protein [Deinococcus aetherius]BDP42887.1 hypothetical protein DAETH_28560 [Deinococcus aetherius]